MTSQKPSPSVDVLIPVFNGALTVEAAVKSILAQTWGPLRVVIVDDGSTDATPEILRRLAAGDARIRVVTTPNHGIVGALNRGLAETRAALVARHDADDIAFPERIERQVSYLVDHPDVVAVGCNVFHIDAAGNRTGTTTHFAPFAVGDPCYAPALEPYLIHPFLLVRREALVACGGYRYSFHSEDADLYWRLSSRGGLANLQACLGEYRLHAQSVSSRSIVNGRIAAVTSQLAALSERRRRAGVVDLTFPAGALAAYESGVELAPIVALASAGLTAAERGALEVGTAAKLVELSDYRPYRLSRTDRRTIRRWIEQHYFELSEANRRHMVFRLIPSRRRLARHPGEVLGLLPWRRLPMAFVELFRFAGRKALRSA